MTNPTNVTYPLDPIPWYQQPEQILLEGDGNYERRGHVRFLSRPSWTQHGISMDQGCRSGGMKEQWASKWSHW